MKSVFHLLKSVSPWLLFANTLIMVVNALAPLALFGVIGILVDKTVFLFSNDANSGLAPIVPWLTLFGGLLFLSNSMLVLGTWASASFSERIRLAISALVHDKVSSLSYQTIQSAQFQSESFVALTGASDRPARILSSSIGLCQSFLTFIVLCLLLGGVRWWLPIVVFLSGVPLLFVRIWFSRRSFKLYKRHSEEERKLSYYNSVITSPHFAPEVRTFGLISFFRNLFFSSFSSLSLSRQSLQRSSSIRQIGAYAFSSVLILSVFFVIILMVADGGLTVGALAMYLMAIRRADSSVRDMAQRSVALHAQSLYIRSLFSFLRYKEDDVSHTDAVPFPESFQTIDFVNVSFTYPGSGREALRNLSFSVRRGEIVGVVGRNGSGKTTVVKLLCALLHPSSGSVSIGGVEVSALAADALAANVAVLFQDFSLYCVSAGRNIWFGDVGRDYSLDGVREAASQTRLDALLSSLREGYDTRLGNTFQGSEMFSRGEWQRLALARVMFSDAPIVILDEPSGSLDAEARRVLSDCVVDMKNQGRTVVIVSHIDETLRLAERQICID